MISRRRFTQAFATAVAGAPLAACARNANVPPAAAPAPSTGLRAGSGKNVSLGPVKHVNAGVLNTAYVEYGPANGPVVLLIHGWPYDPGSYIDVGPLLAAAGYRVIVPYLRGFGPTTFLVKDTVRNAQQSAVTLDIIALMDALRIDTAILGGYDWGARTADIVAALWPERCKALVSVSGYLINSLKDNLQPLPPATEYGWWYQYYFATERGVLGYQRNLHDFNKLIWKIASPQWNFDDETYEHTAKSFTNPDHVAIVIHNYRWRLSLAPGEPQYDGYEKKLAAAPPISVPTITIASDFDGAADGKAYRAKFTGKYEHRILAGIGHNVPLGSAGRLRQGSPGRRPPVASWLRATLRS
jgi:pimeloyl-ACP methyl ester carboxylesterase